MDIPVTVTTYQVRYAHKSTVHMVRASHLANLREALTLASDVAHQERQTMVVEDQQTGQLLALLFPRH